MQRLEQNALRYNVGFAACLPGLTGIWLRLRADLMQLRVPDVCYGQTMAARARVDSWLEALGRHRLAILARS